MNSARGESEGAYKAQPTSQGTLEEVVSLNKGLHKDGKPLTPYDSLSARSLNHFVSWAQTRNCGGRACWVRWSRCARTRAR